jgi:hypothetical protein
MCIRCAGLLYGGAMLEGVKRQVQEQAPEEPAALRHQEEALLKLLRRQVEMAVA